MLAVEIPGSNYTRRQPGRAPLLLNYAIENREGRGGRSASNSARRSSEVGLPRGEMEMWMRRRRKRSGMSSDF